jgi:hypothetical protein
MSPRPGDASQDTQPVEKFDNNTLAVIYYEHKYDLAQYIGDRRKAHGARIRD